MTALPGRLIRPLVSPMVTSLAVAPGGVGNGVVLPPPTTELDFSKIGTDPAGLPAGCTFTRASGATRINHRGYLEEVASNVMRPVYDPTLPYNEVSNPWGDGSPPTGWLASNVAGITISFLASGIRGGIPFIRWNVSGTSVGGGFPNLRTMLLGDTLATIGESFSGQMHFEIVRVGAGNTADISGTNVTIAGYTLANSQQEVGSVVPPNGAGQTFAHGPVRYSRTLNNANTQCVVLRATIVNAIGWVHDWDFEIGFPILNRGTAYLADTVPLATLAARSNNRAQYGLRGHLREDAGTNSISNPRAEGSTSGVIGSGGVAPTGWTMNSAMTIIGTGTESGIPYIDVRVQSVGALSAIALTFQATGTIVAAAGDIWTQSYYVRLLSGSLTGVTRQHSPLWRDAGAATISFGGDPLTVQSLPLMQCLQSSAQTAPASTASVQPRIRLSSTGTCDFTLRIGAPQMEKWPHATSRILPPVASPAVTTRALDLPLIAAANVSLSTGTLAVRLASAANGIDFSPTVNRSAFAITADTSNRVAVIYRTGTGSRKELQVVSGGVAMAQLMQAAALPDVFDTICGSWNAASAAIAINGAGALIDTSVTVPVGTPLGGAPGFTMGGALGSNDVLRFIRFWKDRKLTPAQVRAASARKS